MSRVLSIQSHVVHGYVGNRAATFPLQTRGWDVDVINTVQYSNHPAYGHFTGFKTTKDQLRDLFKGLQDIGTQYDAVLTGYIPDDASLEAAGEITIELAKANPKLKWVLDPVLGDHGRIYVSEGNIEIYKKLLRSGYVFLVTPNQLELEVLSGIKVNDLASLKHALSTFHELYPSIPNVIVTSVQFDEDKDLIYSAGSNGKETFYFKLNKIDASFSGSGDLFSALLTSSYFKYQDKDSPLLHTLNEVLTIVEKVLNLTYEYEVKKYEGVVPKPVKINDLKLIQARDYYLGDYGNNESHYL